MQLEIETVKHKLRKILALAEQGEQGEAAAAQRILSEQLEKYGLSIADLGSDSTHEYEISYGVGIDYNLVLQVVAKLNLEAYKMRWGNNGKIVRHKLLITCTPAVYADFCAHLDHYRAVWDEQMREFFHAFCLKHDLVRTKEESSEENDEPLTQAEYKKLLRLRSMMEGVEKRELKKLLSDGVH